MRALTAAPTRVMAEEAKKKTPSATPKRNAGVQGAPTDEGGAARARDVEGTAAEALEGEAGAEEEGPRDADVVPDAPAGIAEVDGDESDERDGEGEGALLALGIRGCRGELRADAGEHLADALQFGRRGSRGGGDVVVARGAKGGETG